MVGWWGGRATAAVGVMRSKDFRADRLLGRPLDSLREDDEDDRSSACTSILTRMILTSERLDRFLTNR